MRRQWNHHRTVSRLRDRVRPMCLEDPNTGERREVTAEDDFYTLCRLGWKWILQRGMAR
jgi:hypothetical protein